MKRRLTVISMERAAMERHISYLRDFFGKSLFITGIFYYGNSAFPQHIDGDVVLLTSTELTSQVRNKVDNGARIIYVERTMFKEQASHLNDLPENTKAIFLDYTESTAENMVSLLTEFGIRNVDMLPMGRNFSLNRYKTLKAQGFTMVITLGLTYLVPMQIKNVLNLGWAPIDAKTLLEIAMIFNLYDDVLEVKLSCLINDLVTSEQNSIFFMNRTINLKYDYQTIMKLMESLGDGILVFDNYKKVVNYSDNISRMLKINIENRDDVNAELPKTLRNLVESKGMLNDEIIYFPELKKNMLVNILPNNIRGNTDGYILVIRELSKFIQRNTYVQRQLRQNLYHAKYTFDDILGSSDKIRDCKRIAEKFAKTEGTVLITGESGTGKELFAQSIHNASFRKDMPFVAINCAALTPSLLESELFGYERGAFTGSKSEGHVGLFELANNGTIFLDEIGEIPTNIQVKLLRVLEEREIRRVGGEKNVPIDVRVIAATNQNLRLLCKEKRFRLDLYYRLNVLPLPLFPLREHQEDIIILSKHFLHLLRKDLATITPQLENALCTYSWEGNCRELYNCIQYIGYLSTDVLDFNLLPEYIKEELSDQKKLSPQNDNAKIPDTTLSKEEKEILYLLEEQPMVGREKIKDYFCKNGKMISEYHVRQMLLRLKSIGLLQYDRGRNGVQLTELANQKLHD